MIRRRGWIGSVEDRATTTSWLLAGAIANFANVSKNNNDLRFSLFVSLLVFAPALGVVGVQL